jgi:hypothetical protein
LSLVDTAAIAALLVGNVPFANMPAVGKSSVQIPR